MAKKAKTLRLKLGENAEARPGNIGWIYETFRDGFNENTGKATRGSKRHYYPSLEVVLRKHLEHRIDNADEGIDDAGEILAAIKQAQREILEALKNTTGKLEGKK